MKVRIKRLSEDAVVPAKAHPSDAGYDITCTSREMDSDGNIVYHTGLSFEIPEGHCGLLFPRSSIAKKDLLLSNSVGIIDSHYRGEVTAKFKLADLIRHEEYAVYSSGDRIGQLIILPLPDVEFEESDSLSETDRGAGGYGSTGE